MAYGSGVSLTGLSFTPYVAIMIGMKSQSYDTYFTWIAIKGYKNDIGIKLGCAIGGTDKAYTVCKFGSDYATFSKSGTSYFYDCGACIAVFGT